MASVSFFSCGNHKYITYYCVMLLREVKKSHIWSVSCLKFICVHLIICLDTPISSSSSSLLCEQKTRYETYISLLQAKIRAETDDLEKIEASVMGGLIMEGALAGRECHLRKAQSSPSISQAHSGLNGKATGCTAPGQMSWGAGGRPETTALKITSLQAKLV